MTTSTLRRRALLASSTACSLFFAMAEAQALPTGGEVTAGQATITTQGSQVNIHQGTDKAIIQWDNFDTLAGQTTRFYQPGQNSIALNRVNSGTPTHINGNLLANGNVWVVNGSGVVFGQNANVNVSGLLATTSGIQDQDFLEGHYEFHGAADESAAVINNGKIKVASGGLAALVAPTVKNNGTINARMGNVVLGGASNYTLDFYGDGLVNFVVLPDPLPPSLPCPPGQPLPCGPLPEPARYHVENKGIIAAQGGNVVLSAAGAQRVLDESINTSGVIDVAAANIGGKAGTIYIDGGQGIVNVGGTLDASNGYGKGGTVSIYGHTVNLKRGLFIDGRGMLGGGKVEVGGIYGESFPRSWSVNMQQGAKIDVSAGLIGNGGIASLMAIGPLTMNGTIKSRGGALMGNGGLAMLYSPYGPLIFNGKVDLHAPRGNDGILKYYP